MSGRKPVEDWLTDWDHLDPSWVDDPFPIWDEHPRLQVPDRPHRALPGAYLPTRYEDVRDIAYDPEHFSSRQVVVRENQIATGGGAPPITSDPPRHRAGAHGAAAAVHARRPSTS